MLWLIFFDGDFLHQLRTTWGVLWAKRRKPIACGDGRIRWEKKESCLHLNAGANELGQSSHFLTSWWLVGLGRTLTWFGSIYTYVIYSDVMNQELSSMEELKSFRPLVFPRWTSHDHKGRSLLVSRLGFLQVKYFVGRINVRGALARLWTAICMASFVHPGNIAQYLLNWIWNMISFANSNPVIFFSPWTPLFARIQILIRTSCESHSKSFWQ